MRPMSHTRTKRTGTGCFAPRFSSALFSNQLCFSNLLCFWNLLRSGGLALSVSIFPLLCTGCIQRTPTSQASNLPAPAEQDPNAPLPDGQEVLAPARTTSFQLQGDQDKVELSTVDVTGQPFDKALHAQIEEAGGSEWAVQVTSQNATSVEKGDVMLATFFARVVEEQDGGGGETQFVFERASAPYTKSVMYPIQLTTEWRKVQVRFVAGESYGPGEAQAIFRLGYEPETIEVGGVSIQNFKQEVSLARLPTTKAEDQKLVKGNEVAERLPVKDGGTLVVTIDPKKVIGPISPYVYGLNAHLFSGTGATIRRYGGNRSTGYNWERNYSNAGKDFQHQNDRVVCQAMKLKDCEKPAAHMVEFAEENKAKGVETLLTIPLVDYVAADDKGPVEESDTAPSKRFVANFAKKKEPIAAEPDLNDGAVYQNEAVAYVVNHVGKADAGGPKFYALDNEPALWPETHPRLHPAHPTYEEIVGRTERTASAILEVNPAAQILGGVMFGWSEYQSLNSAPDAEKYNAIYDRYVDYFLAMAKLMEKKHKKRLVHVLDIHWYPEARGRVRITQKDASRQTIDARLQATRSLWDPQYEEKSWITDQTKAPIRLIPWLQEIIAKRYPKTKLSMTEYNWGAPEHISGGLAQTMALGVYGREGMVMANYWGDGWDKGSPVPPFIAGAFKMYRNYDGKGGEFGDTAIQATVQDNAKAAVFAATSSKRPTELTVMMVSRSQEERYHVTVELPGYSCPKSFVLDDKGPDPKPGPAAKSEAKTISYPLEPLSAAILICQKKG